MGQPSRRERAQYAFDNWMARGPIAIMALLGAATAVFVLAIAAVVTVLHAYPDGVETGDFWDVAWGNLMRTLDPGTMGADSGWAFRLLMLVVTIGGLIIVASLIGIVSGAFDDKMAELRKGRSRVLESGHTVIVGWNSKLLPIVSELCVANESRKRSVIVILADRDKVEMEEAIRAHVPSPGRTTIVCRRGDSTSIADLAIASPHAARSIIILPPDDDRDPDATVIKTTLALAQEDPSPGAGGPQIVAALRDRRNLEVANLVGRSRAQWLLAGDLVSRMTVQTSRQSGLSTVYTQLLDFDGDEIYFTHQPQFDGLTYLDAQYRFADVTVIGIARNDRVRLNPPASEVLLADDRLIVLAEDDSSVRVSAPRAPDFDVVSTATPQPLRPERTSWCGRGRRSPPPQPLRPERTLILGSNATLPLVVEELSAYVAPGSTICVASDVGTPSVPSPPGIALTFRRVDTTTRAAIEQLDVVTFDHVIVLAYRDVLGPEAADTRTLLTLLHLRDIADRREVRLNIVSEMIDDRNRELAEVTRADDFIVSDRLVSLMLSQVSENGLLVPVFNELFSSDGMEIYLRPASLYIRAGATADFYAVVAAASTRGETAIGYRLGAESRSRESSYGVHLNPPKGEHVTFGPADSVIVLGEELARTRAADGGRHRAAGLS